MYEHAPVQQVIDTLLHIHNLYREAGPARHRHSDEELGRLSFIRGLVDNLAHRRSRLSPQMLGELSRRAALTIGGSFRLAGYPLDDMRKIESLLHGHRTRIIESYPFDFAAKIDLPKRLSRPDVLERTAFISEIVLEWQRELLVQSLQSVDWLRDNLIYFQVGVEDGVALCGIPPGAIVSVKPISKEEGLNPKPDAIYCLQFANGFRFSKCAVAQGKLTLLLYDNDYAGCDAFFYPQQARIVGRAQSFAVTLPPVFTTFSEPMQLRTAAPLTLPWKETSLAELWNIQRMRYGLGERFRKRANEILGESLGITLSGRTLRRYRASVNMVPHTDTLMALTLYHGTRFSDVFRLLGIWQDDHNRHPLSSWIHAKSLDDLESALVEATRPEPNVCWMKLLTEWGEWSALLSMVFPRLEALQDRLLRISQKEVFDGLSPMIRPGSIALLEEMTRFPDASSDRGKPEWIRPIYAVRHKGEVLCGYIDWDGGHIILIPHARSAARRVSFLRHQVEMIGKWIGLASPL